MELVAHLRLEDLDHGGQHPLVGHLTVDEIISDWVHQDRNHFKQMLTNIQEYANDGEREEVLSLALSVVPLPPR